MYAGLGQRGGADFGIAARIVPAVIADGTGFFARLPCQIRAQAACGLPDGIVIQIGDARAHDAADACGAERLLMAEALLDERVVSLHGLQFVQNRALRVRKPALILAVCVFIHRFPPPLYFLLCIQYSIFHKKRKFLFCADTTDAAPVSGGGAWRASESL